jgi:hypothetical protein
MDRPATRRVELTPHPGLAASPVVRRIDVEISQTDEGALRLRYFMDCDVSRIIVPLPAPSRPADQLWKHTCFEIFVALPDLDAYCELNFSPSTEWALYGFVGYRRGMAPIPVRRPPRVAVRPTPRGLALEAVTYLEELPMPTPGSPLRAGAAAVIEERDGRLTYWALTHPSALPDFHHRLGFALQVVAPPRGESDILREAVRNTSA